MTDAADNAPYLDDIYYGFIQAICWASGAEPLTFNEPDELWVPSIQDNIIFDRAEFLRHFAEFDDGPVMMMKPATILINGAHSHAGWEIFCTEHTEAMGYDEAAEAGFAFVAEWADDG